MRVEFVARPGYLEALITGLASLEGAYAVLAQTETELAKRDAHRVLLNCLGVLGQTAPYDHQQLGHALARHLGHARCALVTVPTKLLGVMGAAAQGAGADYRAFADVDEAVAWLCGRAPGERA